MRFQIFVFFVTALVVLTHNLYAEGEEWYPGYVILKTQTKLKGEISVRVDYSVVMFRKGDDLVVYPAYKVQSVSIYDESVDQNRNFISLQREVGAATHYQLYELVLDGQISILRKERILWYSVHLDIPEHDYFVWTENQMISLYMFRRKVLPKLMKSSNGNMKSYIRANKLKPNRLADMVDILVYYNRQKLSEGHLAKKE